MPITYLDETKPKRRVTYLEEEKPERPFLPGYERTEKLISERRPVAQYEGVKDVLKETLLRPYQAAGKIGGEVMQRGQAALANVLMQTQQEKPQQIGLTEIGAPAYAAYKGIRRYGKEFVRGLTGERRGELGDIPRRVGWAEPISATIGLFSTMGITNLATRGKLVTSAKKGEAFVKSKVPKVMNKDYAYSRAKVASEGLDDLYEGLSREYDDMYNAIGDRQVNIARLQEIADDLPQNIVSKINKSKLIQKMPDGSVAPTINNMKIIKNIVAKSIPKSVLKGSREADLFQGNLKYQLGRIRDVMAEGNDELVALNQKYRDFMRMNDIVRRVIYDRSSGVIKSKGLETLYSRGAERFKQDYFKQFSQQWPKAQQIIKDMQKFTTRQMMKRIGGRVALVGGGYYGVRRGISGLFGGGGGGGYEQ